MNKKLKNMDMFKKGVPIITVIALLLMCSLHIPTQVGAATTRTVSDLTMLQNALNAAQDGDTILLTTNISVGTEPLLFDANGRSITIASSIAGTPRVISQSNANIRHLSIIRTGTAQITFSDVIMDGKNLGGGLLSASSVQLTLNNPQIQNCVNSGITNGGAIYVGRSGELNMNNGTISNNKITHTLYSGAGIFVDTSSSLNLNNCTISENNAEYGAGVYGAKYSKITISNSTIKNNDARTTGGGIFGAQNARINIINTTIDNNTGKKAGGIFAEAGCHTTATDSTISDNTASDGSGGGICGEGISTITLSGTTKLIGNSATKGNGGGVYINLLSNVTADSAVTFSGNIAKEARMIAEADKITHAANIKATQFSLNTGYAYNNYDINYTSGTVIVPFSISLQTTGKKVYKPAFAPATAKISTIGTVKVDSDNVQFLMLPTGDKDIINTEAAFNAKAAIIDQIYKGKMHQMDAGSYMYNMYANNDPHLNGVLENCKLIVMAKGLDTSTNSPVIAFNTYTFTNIYTPVDVYFKGETTTGSPIYPQSRVGIGADSESKYGIPLDLNGSVVSNPILGYDTINIEHKDLGDLWKFESSYLDDIKPLVLDTMDYEDKLYTFIYTKNAENWYEATFKFEDEIGTELKQEAIEDDFIPYNGVDSIQYMLGLDQYTPPVITDFVPIGYKINGGTLKKIAFPLQYGEIVLPIDHSIVIIVYAQNQIKITESYHLFERNDANIEVDKGPIKGITSNENFKSDGESFIGAPRKISGYVYRGYSIDGGNNFTEVANYPVNRNDAYLIAPEINPVSKDATIIYKYKLDTTNTGVADEDIKKIESIGTGISASGHTERLYLKTDDVFYGDLYTPTPQGEPDGYGNPTVFVDNDGVSWILSLNENLNSVTPFHVTKDESLRFYYNKDSSGNGKPDYLEANITLKYKDDSNSSYLLNDYLINEFTPTDSFSRNAPSIPHYVAVGVIIYKEGESGTPVYTEGFVKGEIPLLGTNNWVMEFLYQPDNNNNEIPDNIEAIITVKVIYTYLNGTQETVDNTYTGRNGQILSISAATLNKDADKFEYAGGMTTTDATYIYQHDNPQAITINFKEKTKGSNNNSRGGGGSTPTPTPTPSPEYKPTPTPKPTENPSEKEGSINKNNGRPTFDRPAEIFLDGKLIPISRLIFNGPYINGYPDKSIGPERILTRAEAAQIVYNLYGKPDQYVNIKDHLPYKDVSNDAWYAKAVGFLTRYKILTGYPDGLFYPNQPITRAELVTILFNNENFDVNTANENIFIDVVEHWAKAQINAAFKNNIISDFPDKTFRPNDLATRSEAVTIINKMLNRPDKWIGKDNYTDLTENDRAYKKLMNAANGYTVD